MRLACKLNRGYVIVAMMICQPRISPRLLTLCSTSPGEGISDNPIIISDSPEPSSPPRLRRRSSPLTSRSTRSARSSMSRSSRTSPTPEMGESGTRRESRGESSRGGITGWVWSRFGGGGS
jgi:hypothetical protein